MEIDGRPVAALRLVTSRFGTKIADCRRLALATGGTVSVDGARVVIEITDPDEIEDLYRHLHGLEGVTAELLDGPSA